MKVAVVGTGSAGRRHLANLRALGVTDLIAVSEHARREQIEIGGWSVPAMHDYQSCLDAADAVVIANPTNLHELYLDMAIAAGKHVYMEKPAAVHAGGLGRLMNEARRRNLVIAIGTQYRFNERLEDLSSRLKDGNAGRVLKVHAHMGEHIADYHPEEDFRQSYAARSEMGGGVLLTQIHQIDYLNWLFGPFGFAFAASTRSPELGIDVEDCVTYMLLAHSGAAVLGHVDYLQRPKSTSLEVYSTKGRFLWDCFENSLAWRSSSGNEDTFEQSPFDRNAMFVKCMRDFLECISLKRQPRAGLQEAIESLVLVDGFKASIQSNASVRLQ